MQTTKSNKKPEQTAYVAHQKSKTNHRFENTAKTQCSKEEKRSGLTGRIMYVAGVKQPPLPKNKTKHMYVQENVLHLRLTTTIYCYSARSALVH